MQDALVFIFILNSHPIGACEVKYNKHRIFFDQQNIAGFLSSERGDDV